MLKIEKNENRQTNVHEKYMIFTGRQTSRTHSENRIGSFLPTEMLLLASLNIFDTRCRHIPTETVSVPTSNEQLAKNLLQNQNLRTLKCWGPCRQDPLSCFIIIKNRVEGVPATYPGDPP